MDQYNNQVACQSFFAASAVDEGDWTQVIIPRFVLEARREVKPWTGEPPPAVSTFEEDGPPAGNVRAWIRVVRVIMTECLL